MERLYDRLCPGVGGRRRLARRLHGQEWGRPGVDTTVKLAIVIKIVRVSPKDRKQLMHTIDGYVGKSAPYTTNPAVELEGKLHTGTPGTGKGSHLCQSS